MHSRWEHLESTADLVAEARQRPACLGNEELYCSLYAYVLCSVLSLYYVGINCRWGDVAADLVPTMVPSQSWR